MTKPNSLEERLLAAFENPNIGSAALIELISEIEEQAIKAERSISMAREKAADVLAAPTPREAQDAIKVAEAAELEFKRLCGVFSRDRPEIAEVVVLPDFDISSRMRWPDKTSTSFAATYAEMTSSHYHPGSRWADPEVGERRQLEAAREQRRQAEFYSEQTATQESARNESERECFAQGRKRR
jgi:hypothetical protein